MKGDRIYSVLMGRTERNRPLGRRRNRWEDQITMDLQEVGGGGMDYTAVAQVACFCQCNNEPLGSIKCHKFLN
jgi:hypothetical protein